MASENQSSPIVDHHSARSDVAVNSELVPPVNSPTSLGLGVGETRQSAASAFDFLCDFHDGRPFAITGIDVTRKGVAPTETFLPSQREEGIRWIDAAARECNIYFAVATPTERITKKIDTAHVKQINYLWVDVDPPSNTTPETFSPARAAILAHLQSPPAGVPKPTLIVDSGGGYQAFWKLETPIPIEGDFTKAEGAKLYNLQLERVFEADHTHDPARIMRLPFVTNRPNEKKQKRGQVPIVASVVEWHRERAYPLSAFTKASPKSVSIVAAGESKIIAPANVRRIANLESDPALAKVKPSVRVYIARGENPDEPGHFQSRSEALFWVCCELVRAGVPDETIFAIITDPGFRISESVIEQGSRAEKYALRQIERAKEEAVDPILRELNDRHAVICNLGSKCRVIEEVPSAAHGRTVVEPQGFDDFRNRYLNRMVNLGPKTNAKGKVVGDIEMSAGEFWLRHPQRRQFSSVVYSPNRDVPGAYNLWRGFAFEPTPGDWSLFKTHIRENICGGDNQLFAYVLGWMASAVQFPGEPGHTILVLQGQQGCGKSHFGHTFGRLFGQHYFCATSPEDVLSHFNSQLQAISFLFADEAFFAGDPRNARRLKTLATDPYLTIERKGVNKEQARNCLHVVMAGNDERIVQVDSDDRRYVVLSVLGTRANDHAYFQAIAQQMERGGYSAMLFDLLDMDLSGFNVRAKPDTAGLQKQKHLSMDPESKWVLGLLTDGIPDSAQHGQLADVAFPGQRENGTRDGLYQHARQSVPELRSVSDNRLSDVLKALGVRWTRKTDGNRVQFPPLPTMRADFDRKWGCREWPGGPDAQWGWCDELLPVYPDTEGPI